MSERLHPLEQMLRQDIESNDDDIRKEDQDTELQKTTEEPKRDSADTNKEELPLSERLMIARNKEASKALLAWRIENKISRTKQVNLTKDQTREFLNWAMQNDKINFEKNPKLKLLYQNYVETEQIINRITTAQSKGPELPTVMIDPEYAKENEELARPSHKFEIKSGTTLANILHNKKVQNAYGQWVEQFDQDGSTQRLGSKEKIQEFIDWAITNTDINFSKLLKEKNEVKEKNETLQEKEIKKYLIKLKTDKKLQILTSEWRKINAADKKRNKIISSPEDALEFLNWVTSQQTEDLTAKEYNKIMELSNEFEKLAEKKPVEKERERHRKKAEEDEMPKVMLDEVFAEEVHNAREKIEKISYTDKTRERVEKNNQRIKEYTVHLQAAYNISVDEKGIPLTNEDGERLNKLLKIAEEAEQKNTSSMWGKLKKLFTNISVSEKDRMNAKAFKTDYTVLLEIVEQNSKQKKPTDVTDVEVPPKYKWI